MIATSAEHAALLATRIFWAVDLYAIVMLDGSVSRYVQHGAAIAWNGYTWQGGGPRFTRGKTRIVRGLEADSLDVEIVAKDTDLLLGIPFVSAVRNGALDGARLELWRGHAATPGAALVGAIQRFGGNVENVNIEDTIKLTVKSDLAKFDAPIPRAVYQPECDRTLYSTGCGASRVAHQLNTTAGAGSTASVVKVAEGVLGSIDYSGGELRFVSGANAGARRSIRAQTDGVSLALSYPLMNAVSAGEQIQLWPGCKHDWDDCVNKFGNTRFRGQPFIPVPETVL